MAYQCQLSYIFLKPFCARYTTKLTNKLKRYDSTTGYLQLRLIGQSPTYIKVELLPQVKTQGCLLAVFKEKPAELAITPELAITSELVPPLPAYVSVISRRLTFSVSIVFVCIRIKGITHQYFISCRLGGKVTRSPLTRSN